MSGAISGSTTTAGSHRPEVFLVDDDIGFVETLIPLLASAGFNVIAEFTYAAAHRYLSSHTPDLLVTDLRLRDGDGWTLAEYARTHQPTLPVVVVTGWSLIEERDEAHYGRIPVFLKPFDSDAFTDYLHLLLTGRRRAI
jgi:DNA-binding NtrC family response regulator